MVMEWLIKRIFSDKIVGYLIEKVRPRLKEEFLEISKEAIDDILTDEEFHKRLTEVGDAYYDRYRRKVMGTIGALQQNINKIGDSTKQPQFDFFDEEGRLSIKKILPMVFSGGIQSFFRGKQAQSGTRSTEQGQNAPEM